MKNFNFKFYFFRFKNVLAVLFVSFLVNSCKKDLNVAGIDSNATNPVSLEMQKWLTDQKFDSVKIFSINTLRKKVQWDKANSILGDSSLSYDIAPMTLDTVPKFDDPSLTITKYLVFTKVNGIINNSAIIDLFGNKETLTRDYNKLIVSYYHKRQDSFTGIITINNIFGGFNESKEYISGILKFKRVLEARGKSNGKTILGTDKKISSGCIDWYWCTYYYGVEIAAEYLFTTCDGGGECEQTSIIDHKAVQSIHSLCGGGGGGGGGDSNNTSLGVIVKTDTLLANFPCAVRQILEGLEGVRNFSEMLEPFTTNARPNITYTDKNLPWNLNGNGQTMLGNTSVDQSGGLGLSSIVTLNDNMLQNSSKLMIAAAFIHETLHASINYNVELNNYNNVSNMHWNSSWVYSLDFFYDQNGLPPNFRDHSEMITTYFNQAVQTLQLFDNYQHTLKEYEMAMLFGLDTSDSNATSDEKNRLNQEYLTLQVSFGISPGDLNTFWSNELNSTQNKLPNSGCQ